jgi:hypothetical protein
MTPQRAAPNPAFRPSAQSSADVTRDAASPPAVAWQVLHGAPALDISSFTVLPKPSIPLLDASGDAAAPPVAYTLAFWHTDDGELDEDEYRECLGSDDPPSCGDWSALLVRGSFSDNVPRAPGVFLHRATRRLLIQHASARDGGAHIATRRGAHPARVWNHVGVVVNRTTLSYYRNGTLAHAIGLDGDDDEFTWGLWGSATPLTANTHHDGMSLGRLRGVVWANEAASEAEVRRVMQLYKPEEDETPEQTPTEEEDDENSWW